MPSPFRSAKLWLKNCHGKVDENPNGTAVFVYLTSLAAERLTPSTAQSSLPEVAAFGASNCSRGVKRTP
jgi:hypothetical protein